MDSLMDFLGTVLAGVIVEFVSGSTVEEMISAKKTGGATPAFALR